MSVVSIPWRDANTNRQKKKLRRKRKLASLLHSALHVEENIYCQIHSRNGWKFESAYGGERFSTGEDREYKGKCMQDKTLKNETNLTNATFCYNNNM